LAIRPRNCPIHNADYQTDRENARFQAGFSTESGSHCNQRETFAADSLQVQHQLIFGSTVG
jgi:hypothetical protein